MSSVCELHRTIYTVKSTCVRHLGNEKYWAKNYDRIGSFDVFRKIMVKIPLDLERSPPLVPSRDYFVPFCVFFTLLVPSILTNANTSVIM